METRRRDLKIPVQIPAPRQIVVGASPRSLRVWAVAMVAGIGCWLSLRHERHCAGAERDRLAALLGDAGGA
jgi:hypothetical protein